MGPSFLGRRLKGNQRNLALNRIRIIAIGAYGVRFLFWGQVIEVEAGGIPSKL